MKSAASRFIVEILLWNAANVLCLLIPSAVVFLVGKELLGWGPGYMSFYLTSTVLATLTWGSWASLVWTRNRALRGGMQFTTLLPGVLTVGAGGLGLWVGFGAWFIWAGLIAAGVGMLGAALALVRYFRPVNREPSASAYLFGFGVYPLATTAAGLAVGTLWYNFVTNPTSGDWRSIVSVATLYVTVLAMALISTVIPAVFSSGLRKVSGDLIR